MRTAVITGIVAVISFFSGIFASDFVGYRSDTRDRVKSEIEAYTQSTKELDEVLKTFAAIAAGERPVKDDDIEKLHTSLLNLQREARGVTGSLPELAPEYAKLDTAILALLSVSKKTSTADKNKPFVAAVIGVVEEADEFMETARNYQSRYLTGLRL